MPTSFHRYGYLVLQCASAKAIASARRSASLRVDFCFRGFRAISCKKSQVQNVKSTNGLFYYCSDQLVGRVGAGRRPLQNGGQKILEAIPSQAC